MKKIAFEVSQIPSRNLALLIFFVLFFLAMAVSLFASMLPFASGGYSTQRFYLCILIALFSVVGVLGFFKVKGAQERNFWPLILLLGIGVSVSIAALYSGSRFRWIEPGLYFGFFVSVVLVGSFIGRNFSVHLVAEPVSVILGVTVGWYAAIALLYYVFFLFGSGGNVSDYLPWGFVNIRYWGQVATWLLPLLPMALINRLAEQSKLWQLVVLLGAASWIWIAILSSARGTGLSLLAGILFALIFFRKASLLWLKLFGLVLLCGAVMWIVLSILIPGFIGISVEGRELSVGGSGRWVLWQEAFAMSVQNFPFGMGPQAWLVHSPLTESYSLGKPFGHPHNMYLLWAAEYGWWTLILILGLFAWMGRQLLRLRTTLIPCSSPKANVALCGFAVSVFSALCHAGISAVFIAPASMLIGLFVLIIFFAMLQSPGSEREVSKSIELQRSKLKLCVVAGISAIAISWLVEVHEYHQAMLDDLPGYLDQPTNAYFPRFWYHGYFPRSGSQ